VGKVICECRTEDGRIIYMAPTDCRVAEMAVEREDKVKAWCVEVPRFKAPPGGRLACGGTA
jgi:hypothetical protein